MSGNKYLLDTNIALYLLGGDQQLSEFLVGVEMFVSIITEIELLAYPSLSSKEVKAINGFLQSIEIITLSPAIKETTIRIRKEFRLKLPDSKIAATSLVYDYPLITSDKSFQRIDKIILLDYK
jgi:predicted nucleic acid-binding protein